MHALRIQYIIAITFVGVLFAGVVVWMGESTVFFHTPAEVLAAPERFHGRTIRIGALALPQSTRWDAERVELHFQVAEAALVPPEQRLRVVFTGVKPDLYREGQGVVVQGHIDPQGVFRAHELLVKHSAEYTLEEDPRAQSARAARSLIQPSRSAGSSIAPVGSSSTR